MARDLSNIITHFITDLYSYRNDLGVQVKKNKVLNNYTIHFSVYIKPTDGLYATINKGIDKFSLMNQLQNYFNFSKNDCVITYQNVYSETIT